MEPDGAEVGNVDLRSSANLRPSKRLARVRLVYDTSMYASNSNTSFDKQMIMDHKNFCVCQLPMSFF